MPIVISFINVSGKQALSRGRNNDNNGRIRRLLEKMLHKELSEKTFVADRKFEIIGERIDSALKRLGLEL